MRSVVLFVLLKVMRPSLMMRTRMRMMRTMQGS